MGQDDFAPRGERIKRLNARMEQHFAESAERAMAISLASATKGAMINALALFRDRRVVVANARWRDLQGGKQQQRRWCEIGADGTPSAPRASTIADLALEMLDSRASSSTPLAPRVFEDASDGLAVEIQIDALSIGVSERDLVIVHDVTSRVQLERKLHDALAERERLRALARIGELSAMAAHEIRNPLAVIENVGTLLERSMPATPDSSALIAILHEETARLGEVVSQLLAFGTPRRPDPKPTSVRSLASSAAAAACADRSNRRVRIEVEPDGVDVDVIVDPDMMRMVLVNLLCNAIDASPDNSAVRVCVASTPTADGMSSIEVSDRGTGIASEVRDQLFEPFVSSKPIGAGLGLAIVKQFVEAHGGHVMVDSDTERGTTFTLFVPSHGTVRAKHDCAPAL